MDNSKGGGLKKRQQIAKSNRTMFLWITGVSVVVGFSVVLMIFLAQGIWYGERVILEKQKTADTLKDNLEIVPKLKDSVSLLNTNEDLQSVRLDSNDPALQVILDALPADANSTAMASSLQTRLLSGVGGIIIESLRVEPVSGVEDDSSDSDSGDSEATGIGFSFTISTTDNQDGLRKILQQIERSIRPFTIDTMSIESQGGKVTLSADGRGFYEPAQKVQLTDKVVKP